MQIEYLAKHITVFMSIAAVGLVAAVGVPLDWVRKRLNEESAKASVHLVQERINTLHGQVRMMVQDYNNWSDVYFAAINGDINFIADNYAITAINGAIFDGAVMFDGPFGAPIAWIKGGTRSPTSSFLGPEVLSKVRAKVRDLPWHDRPTFDFLMVRGGRLTFLSASRLLPDTPEAIAVSRGESVGIAIIARSVRSAELNAISTSLNLLDLQFSLTPKNELAHLDLLDADGHPIGYLNWSPPRDGDRLFLSISPILAFVLLVFALTALGGISLLRRVAQLLVQREAHATKLARVDVLTGLPNRLAFTEHIAMHENASSGQLSIVLIDLNGFKIVNDLVGHPGGDEIIKEFSQRIGALSTSRCFVSRMGGDEFVVVVTDSERADSAASKISEQVVAALQVPFNYQGCSFDMSASFGIASRSSEIEPTDELLRQADRAMYHSKRCSGNQVTDYDPSMDLQRTNERLIERELRSSLHRPTEFSVDYQPIVDASSHTLLRVEALARWTSSVLGPVRPETFISLAERSGLISSLGDILLEQIFSEVAAEPGLKVSVNISPLQLLSPGFVGKVDHLASKHGLPASCVEFELTEGVVVQNFDAVRLQLQRLEQYGFSTALDDFGTGFSSIGYLRQMPFSTLKIDRSFISGIVSREQVDSVISPIILLGHAMGKSITAEGIETADEAELLTNAGCDRLQGYYFGKPECLSSLLTHFLPTWPVKKLSTLTERSERTLAMIMV